MRRRAGQVQITNAGGFRRLSFVMGGSVKISEGEWLEWIQAERPVSIYRDDLLLMTMPQPSSYLLDPWAISYGTLQFRRMVTR